MSLGRRKVRIDQPARWVFNRMAESYDARPAYPPPVLDAIQALARGIEGRRPRASRICDVGAGVGHLALPLTERGFDVVAVEPARRMLDKLQASAVARGLTLRAVHAPAESLPLENASVDTAVVADALHFLDAQLTAEELDRVLRPHAALAVVTCRFGDTPFMREVQVAVEEAVPRRPRDVARQLVHLASITRVHWCPAQEFHDATPVDHVTLERILRSISFIGPAMNAERFARFHQRIRGLTEKPVWARSFVVHTGRRGRTHRGAQR